MSLVSEIKCARCDRKYSGVRSRCPYCGARRIGRGKYTEDADNTKGKMLISILIMSCLVVAAGILLFTTDMGAEAALPPAIIEPENGAMDTEDITSLQGTHQGASRPDFEDIEEPEEPEEPPSPAIRSIDVRSQHGRMGGDVSINVGEVLNLTVRIEPVGVEAEVTWESSNSNAFEVVPTNPEGTEARLTGAGRNTNGYLVVTVGDVVSRHMIRVRGG